MRVVVSKLGKETYIKDDNTHLCNTWFDKACLFDGNYARVEIGGLSGLIDIQGNYVIPCLYEYVFHMNGLFFIKELNKKSYNIYNSKLECLIPDVQNICKYGNNIIRFTDSLSNNISFYLISEDTFYGPNSINVNKIKNCVYYNDISYCNNYYELFHNNEKILITKHGSFIKLHLLDKVLYYKNNLICIYINNTKTDDVYFNGKLVHSNCFTKLLENILFIKFPNKLLIYKIDIHILYVTTIQKNICITDIMPYLPFFDTFTIYINKERYLLILKTCQLIKVDSIRLFEHKCIHIESGNKEFALTKNRKWYKIKYKDNKMKKHSIRNLYYVFDKL